MMRRQLEDMINNPIIMRIALAYYDYFYLPLEVDGELVPPEDRSFRIHNHEGGLCEQCNWERVQAMLQGEIVSAGAIAMTKVQLPGQGELDQVWKAVIRESRADALLTRNPVMYEPRILEFQSPKPAWCAGYIASKLSNVNVRPEGGFQLQHIVTRLDKSRGLDMLYNADRHDLLEEIMAFAPVLVYAENSDRRDNNGTVYSLLDRRQYGLAIVIRSK